MKATLLHQEPILINDPKTILRYCDVRAVADVMWSSFQTDRSGPHPFTQRKLLNQVEKIYQTASHEWSVDFTEAFEGQSRHCRFEITNNALAVLVWHGWVIILDDAEIWQRRMRPQLLYFRMHEDLVRLIGERWLG